MVINRPVTSKGMASDEFKQFLISAAVLMMGGFVVGAALTSPDPFTQAAVMAVLLPLVLVASYALAYRRGFEWT
jgi:hypothetical protein